jgi:hypothetical protein
MMTHSGLLAHKRYEEQCSQWLRRVGSAAQDTSPASDLSHELLRRTHRPSPKLGELLADCRLFTAYGCANSLFFPAGGCAVSPHGL